MGNVHQIAAILVSVYGNAAPQEAARRSDDLRQKGDADLSQMWLAVRESAEAIRKSALQAKASDHQENIA